MERQIIIYRHGVDICHDLLKLARPWRHNFEHTLTGKSDLLRIVRFLAVEKVV